MSSFQNRGRLEKAEVFTYALEDDVVPHCFLRAFLYSTGLAFRRPVFVFLKCFKFPVHSSARQ